MNLHTFLKEEGERFDEEFPELLRRIEKNGWDNKFEEATLNVKSFNKQSNLRLIKMLREEVEKIDWRNGGLGNTPYDDEITDYYISKRDDLLALLTVEDENNNSN